MAAATGFLVATSAGVRDQVLRRKSRSSASRWYLLPMFVLLATVVTLVAVEFAQSPLPPGVDPGHWLSASYAYVGLPTAPDPANQPGVYSPLTFPFLGLLVRLFGDPAMAASIWAVALLAGYGATSIHLSRRYLEVGAAQLAFVGGALGCGTTLQMLFWGAYPNILGFITFNEAMLFFLLFLREGKSRDAVALYAAVGLTYFAHDLSFFLLVAALGGATFFLLALRRLSPRFLVDRRNLLGALGVAGAIGTYSAVTARLGIAHPSYFFSNPSAYYVDEIGEIFVPLGHYPAFFPSGATVLLDPWVATALLLAATPILLVALLLLKRWRPGALSNPLAVAAGWLSAVAAVPAVGYLLHVDTDYERFLYFLPLPLLLLLVVLVERLALLPRAPPTEGGPPGAPPWSRLRPYRPAGVRGGVWGTAVVCALIFLLFSNVTYPVVQAGEASGTGAGHDAGFMAAAQWLSAQTGPGNLLTVSTVSRWTEALTNRMAFTVGPVWLLFDPFEVRNAEESYWTLSSESILANGSAVLSFSGFNTTVLSQAPLYTVYDEGVPFPIFRVLPGALALNATTSSGTRSYPAMGGSVPLLSVPDANGSGASVQYTSPVATVLESAGPPGRQTAITFTVLPRSGASVHSLSIALAAPPGGSPLLSRDAVDEITYSPGHLNWSVHGALGQYPYPAVLTGVSEFSELPTYQGIGRFDGAPEWTGTFPAAGSGPFTLTLTLSALGAADPTDALPSLFHSATFLTSHDIRFLLWPAGSYYAAELAYFEAEFGFRPAYANSEWVILEA